MLSDRSRLRFLRYMIMAALLVVAVTTKVTSSALPPLKSHPLPSTLAQWETVSEVGDYFSAIEESPLGYLLWSEFPVTVYLDQSEQDEKWREAVETAVQEWNRYFPLQVSDDRATANIIITRSRPPLNTTRNPETGMMELSRARSARTRYEFALKPTNEGKKLIHRMKIEISPDQSQRHTLATARHEIGHAVGIWGHSPNPEDALYFSQVRNASPISDRDINTLKRIYQQPTRLGHPIN